MYLLSRAALDKKLFFFSVFKEIFKDWEYSLWIMIPGPYWTKTRNEYFDMYWSEQKNVFQEKSGEDTDNISTLKCKRIHRNLLRHREPTCVKGKHVACLGNC